MSPSIIFENQLGSNVNTKRINISLFSTNSAHHELDGTSDAAWLEVEVVEPVAPDMGMEVSFWYGHVGRFLLHATLDKL